MAMAAPAVADDAPPSPPKKLVWDGLLAL